MPLTMAQGMKRLGTPIAALLCLGLVALIATSSSLRGKNFAQERKRRPSLTHCEDFA